MTYRDSIAAIKTEKLLEAKKLNVKVEFSPKLIWHEVNGELRLLKEKQHRSGKLTVYTSALVVPQQTLYVHRPLLNVSEVATWAREQGFQTVVPDMHVTIVFSKQPVEWNKFTPLNDQVVVKGGERSMEVFGPDKDAAVLRFVSEELQQRWNQFMDGGASSDYPSYQPHVTISFKASGFDITKVKPYDGPLVFGPEVWGEVKENWKDTIVENEFDESQHPRDEDGKFTFGGGGDGGGGSSGGASEAHTAGPVSSDAHPAAQQPGISSSFDLRPQQPMSSQSGIVTVKDIGMAGSKFEKTSFTNVAVTVNPTLASLKSIIKESDFNGARALQDRAGNLFVWNAGDAIHYQMMDALEPVETMWASDQFDTEHGKVVSQNAPGTDTAQKWVDRGQDNAKNADKTTVTFVSPNVSSGLDFNGAVGALNSAQQGSLLAASAFIDRELGIKAKETGVIGAWADGAENSIMMTAGSDWDHAVLAGAMKGALANQKSVLVFQQDRKGDSVLSTFTAHGNLEDIHKNLLADGLAFHTLVPIKGGAIVHVADKDGSLLGAVKAGAARYDAKVTVQIGRAEYIGDTAEQGTDSEQRQRAQGVYEGIIGQSKLPDGSRIWTDVRDRWGTPTKIGAYNPRLITTVSDKQAGQIKNVWAAAAGDKIKTVQDLMQAAVPAQEALATAGEAVAEKLKLEFKNPGPKTNAKRIQEKMDERGYPAARIADAARATFVVDTPAQAEQAATELAKTFEVNLEPWKMTGGNYIDRAMTVRLPNGVMAEVQMMAPAMALAKSGPDKGGGGGHDLYVEWRALNPSSPEAVRLVNRMQEIYGAAADSLPSSWKPVLKQVGYKPYHSI